MVLVDTSVWIDLFRRPTRLQLQDVVDIDEVATCLPVIQEVLQGISADAPFRTARSAMLAMPLIESPVTAEVYLEAAELYRRGRRAGVTIRSATDCLIAACAIRHDLEVLHNDRDYPALARISSLRERQI